MARVAVVTFGAVACFMTAFDLLNTAPTCSSTYSNQFGCLGRALLVIAVGGLLLWLTIALSMHRLGPRKATLGAALVVASMACLVQIAARGSWGDAVPWIGWPITAALLGVLYVRAARSACERRGDGS